MKLCFSRSSICRFYAGGAAASLDQSTVISLGRWLWFDVVIWESFVAWLEPFCFDLISILVIKASLKLYAECYDEGANTGRSFEYSDEGWSFGLHLWMKESMVFKMSRMRFCVKKTSK